jgi:DNA-binding MarR family transcriptional regulator
VISTDVATAQRLRVALVRVTRALRRYDADLTQSQLSALATIADVGPLRLSALAAHEHVAASVATRVVASLEELGLVSRGVDPDDGRASLVRVTARGTATIHDLRSERTRELAERLARLSASEHATIERALDALEKLARD